MQEKAKKLRKEIGKKGFGDNKDVKERAKKLKTEMGKKGFRDKEELKKGAKKLREPRKETRMDTKIMRRKE